MELLQEFFHKVLGGQDLGPTILAFVVGYGLSYLLNKLPNLTANWVGRKIDFLLEKGDDADDRLVLAIVQWAEAKLPDGQKGKEKFQMVADKVVMFLPFYLRLLVTKEKVEEVIERNVTKMKEKFKEFGLHKPPL